MTEREPDAVPQQCDDEIVEFDVPTDFGPLPPPVRADATEGPASETVEVRRRAGLAACVGVVAAAVAAAYLVRAAGPGGTGSWVVGLALTLVALAYLGVLADSRTPLLVADGQGVRLRSGRTWSGYTWDSLRGLEVSTRAGLRDGRLVLLPRADERAPGVPLGLSTRVVGEGHDVVAALRSLAGDRVAVVLVADGPAEVVDASAADEMELPDEEVPAPGPHRWHDPRPALAHGIGLVAARLRAGAASGTGSASGSGSGAGSGSGSGSGGPVLPAPVVASATPSPLRQLVSGRRTEVRRDLVDGATALRADTDDDTARHDLPEAFVLRRPGAVELEVDDETWGSYGERVRPIAVPGEALETIVIDDFAIEPAMDPVIGPEFLAARTHLGLTVDQLAERTRIRPHVIESIEADDFVPCGGDFYARGHIRTLARILGVDAAPLLAAYDERYADAPVNPRRVFEAELAHNGGIRATRGGPNWSVLVAAVMALVLAWSIARLVMDTPVGVRDQPVLTGSGGPNHRGVPAAAPVPVVIAAPATGARVIVRDGTGAVIFTGDLAFGATKTLSVSPPVRVQATDGSVTVTVGGQAHGPRGAPGSPGSGTFVVR